MQQSRPNVPFYFPQNGYASSTQFHVQEKSCELQRQKPKLGGGFGGDFGGDFGRGKPDLSQVQELEKKTAGTGVLNDPKFTLHVYVEDRVVQKGPFLLVIHQPERVTVKTLKWKAQRDWNIPMQLQRWILGGKIADDDSTLSDFYRGKGGMAFLCVVAPNIKGNVSRGNKTGGIPKASCVVNPTVRPAFKIIHGGSSGGGGVYTKQRLVLPSSSKKDALLSNDVNELRTGNMLQNLQDSETSNLQGLDGRNLHEPERPNLQEPERRNLQEPERRNLQERERRNLEERENPNLQEPERRNLQKPERRNLELPEKVDSVQQVVPRKTGAVSGENNTDQQPSPSSSTARNAKIIRIEPNVTAVPKTNDGERKTDTANASEEVVKTVRKLHPTFPKPIPVITDLKEIILPETFQEALAPLEQDLETVEFLPKVYPTPRIISEMLANPWKVPATEQVQETPEVTRDLPEARIEAKLQEVTQIQLEETNEEEPELIDPEGNLRVIVQELAEAVDEEDTLPVALLEETQPEANENEAGAGEQLILADPIEDNLNVFQADNATGNEVGGDVYAGLLALAGDSGVIAPHEPFDCPICFTTTEPMEGIVLRNCLHMFCRDCITGVVANHETAQITCPYIDENYSCTSIIEEREIKATVPEEIYERYLGRSVKLAELTMMNTFHCLTTDCKGWCVLEGNVNIFYCPVCQHRNCISCKAIHDDVNCEEYQASLRASAASNEDTETSLKMLEELIRKGEALDCPSCHVVLLKKWGCDWVRCSYCKTEICWITKGFRWGPNGKGDTSGGCKCGVNGVKCHPKCTYCH